MYTVPSDSVVSSVGAKSFESMGGDELACGCHGSPREPSRVKLQDVPILGHHRFVDNDGFKEVHTKAPAPDRLVEESLAFMQVQVRLLHP